MEAEATGTGYDAGGTSGAEVETDVDWEGERRWHDKPWIFAVATIGGGCVGIASVGWLMGIQSVTVFGIAWLLMALFCIWLALRLRRKIAREIGVSVWQLPVVARRLQKERVPRDPVARRALALLARRQRKRMRNLRWMWPAMAALYLLLGIMQWAGGATGMAVFWLVVAVGSCASYFQYRRAIARADRVLSRVGADAVPGH